MDTPDPLDALLCHLDGISPERASVTSLSYVLGMTRPAFAAFLEARRDALAGAGVMLHAATVSQVGPRLSVLVNGRYITALSVPRPDTVAVATIRKLLTMCDLEELANVQACLRDAVDALTPAPGPTERHETYHRQRSGGRAYWYAFRRDAAGKLHKRYCGKTHPETGELA